MATARPTTWLVTGANRGIGLEIVAQLLQSSDNLVIAACRTPEKATALDDLEHTAKGTLHVIQLDVSDFNSVRASAKALEQILGEISLDYLINNAGISVNDTAFSLEPETLLDILKTNTVGPALISQVALPFLEKGSAKKVLHISSICGSIASAGTSAGFGAEYTSYGMSKVALNMLAYKQKLERPDFVVIALCPGWVKTAMGGQNAALEPRESVAGVLKVITTATAADSGKYLRYNGETIPW